MERFRTEKSLQALVRFGNLGGGSLNKMKALKLIWLSDRYHLRQYGRTITGDQYFAMKNGPVASCTFDLLKGSGVSFDREAIQNIAKYLTFSQYNYTVHGEADMDAFSETDTEVIDLIWEKYKHYDHFALSELSHNFPEWIRYKANFENAVKGRYEIIMDDFFVNVNDKIGLFNDSEEFLNESREIFLEFSA
ncbi:Panacea domain-containing protein [Dyadobacter arcticus]|uniref:Phage-associated protein n=1 Tax=Dyadobacter arcticus TaxID=1078754 RepID=A0ABX0UUM1_9BACT|nr:Panacea domain-containing protein [Dyadobacter arcticus]NIJ55500.1 putative phage-associated protein [Dyadobacter arcticus]